MSTPMDDQSAMPPQGGDAQAQPQQQQAPARNFLQTPEGNAEDVIREQRAQDPTSAEDVTMDEQAEYEDFVNRCILFISDNRKPNPETPSPFEATMNMLNNPKLQIPDAIGVTSARIVFNIHNNAKRQGVTYDPDVLFHGTDELIAGLYVLGNQAGIFKGDPPIQFQGGAISEIEFDDQQNKMLIAAKMKAVLEFGRMLEQTGQITEEQRKEARTFWKQQIEREMQSGQVSDAAFDKLDINALRQQMASTAEHGYDPNGEQQAPDEQEPPQDTGANTDADMQQQNAGAASDTGATDQQQEVQ